MYDENDRVIINDIFDCVDNENIENNEKIIYFGNGRSTFECSIRDYHLGKIDVKGKYLIKAELLVGEKKEVVVRKVKMIFYQ